jgi:cytochrome c2
MLGDEAYLKEGERLMEQLACRRCHVSGGRGNRLAASLDGAAARKTAGELALSIRQPVANMPNFSLPENRITMLVNAILAGSQGHETAETAPVQVHFNTSGKKRADIFSVKCGGCHRMLTERLGALGTGDSGPNLSGLFSPFYPKSFRNGEMWNARNLGVWLKNPRESRPWARMMPVILTGPETKELVQLMADGMPKK